MKNILLSAMYAVTTVAGKNKKVTMPSQTVTSPGVMTAMIMYIHKYAKTLHVAVMKNTRKCLILRTSPSGITYTHIPMITNKLKAALPTIVLGPRSPASKRLPIISITDSRISGADDPRAMSVKLETVSFQIRTLTTAVSPFGFLTVTSRSLDVITSIAAMKRSAMMDTPRNRKPKPQMYTVALAALSPALRLPWGVHKGKITPFLHGDAVAVQLSAWAPGIRLDAHMNNNPNVIKL